MEETKEIDNLFDLMENLLEGPYWIVDILPEQVPADSDGQYFAVDAYFRQPGRLQDLYRRFAEMILRLNCYNDMLVSFDSCETWTENPEPEWFAEKLTYLKGNEFLRVVFVKEKVMIDIDSEDTNMTVFAPDEDDYDRYALMCRIRKLAAASGFFMWIP